MSTPTRTTLLKIKFWICFWLLCVMNLGYGSGVFTIFRLLLPLTKHMKIFPKYITKHRFLQIWIFASRDTQIIMTCALI